MTEQQVLLSTGPPPNHLTGFLPALCQPQPPDYNWACGVTLGPVTEQVRISRLFHDGGDLFSESE